MLMFVSLFCLFECMCVMGMCFCVRVGLRECVLMFVSLCFCVSVSNGNVFICVCFCV